jgi:hypothetical protein
MHHHPSGEQSPVKLKTASSLNKLVLKYADEVTSVVG